MAVTNTVAPTVNGTARVGQTLTTSNGTWTHDTPNTVLSYTYRWLRCDAAGANCVAVPGATNSSYALTNADLGYRLRSEVTAVEVAEPSGSILYQQTYTGAVQGSANPNPYPYGWQGDWLVEGGGTATLVTNGLTTGLNSMRFTMPANAHGHIEGNNYPWQTAQGQHMFIGFQFKLPLNWTQSPNIEGWGCTLCQTYYQSCCNHTIGLFLHTDHCRCVILSGEQSWTQTPNFAGQGLIREYNNGDGAAQGPSPRVIPVGRLTLNVWHTIIQETVCSYDSPGGGNVGLFRSWHRIATDPGSPAVQADYPDTVSVTGIPTLQWTAPEKCNNNYYVVNKYQSYPTSQKFGYYSGPANWVRSFEQANIVFGTTFDVVAAEMV